MLGNHIWSLPAQSDRPDLSSTFLQPFISYTTKDAWTFSLNTESTYDWETNDWSVPINFTVAKLITIDKQPISLTAGIRYWADAPDNGPNGLGFRVALTFLFPKWFLLFGHAHLPSKRQDIRPRNLQRAEPGRGVEEPLASRRMLEVGEPEDGGRTGLAAQHEATASVRAGLAAELDAPPVFKSGEEVFDVVALAVEPPLVVWLQYFKQAAQRPFHRLH